jgi:hypothetical protein
MNDNISRLEYRGEGYRPSAGARVVLMTATISPPTGAVARSDPQVRIRDYCDALEFYIGLPSDQFDRIVFADNSASDLAPMYSAVAGKCHGKTVELLSFQANDHAPALGKAYGEFRLIDTALKHSQFIGPQDRIWKTTGRLRCLNLGQLDRAIDGDVDMACDLHNVPFVGTGKMVGGEMMDLRLFAFRAQFYEQMIRGRWLSAGSEFDAHFMYGLAVQAAESWRVEPRFPRQPIISGMSGRTQRDYLGPAQRMKDRVRGIMRRIAPRLWL